jgi:putative selenate reductase molybdopterin-binding subunit
MKEVGRKIRKLDGSGLIEGRPAYTDDLAPHNALIIKVLRSPYAFARIKRIDTQKAEDMPGVACVLTYKNVPHNIHTRAGQGFPEPSPYDKYILDEYVRYCGDEAAAVAAATETQAEAALKAIDIEYEPLEPVLDFEMAVDNPSVIHPEPEAYSKFEIGMDAKRNIAASYRMDVGNVDETVKTCDIAFTERYYTQAQAHVMMEPHAAAAYLDVHQRLNIITSTQTPFHARRIIASTLGIPRKDVRVIKPRVGGGFGGKQAIHGELLAALVTLKTGRPSKLVYTRKEVFEASYTRHPMRIDITLGAMKDGRIRAIGMDILSDTGAYGEHALTVLMVAGSKTLPIYNKAEAVRFDGTVVYTNLTPAGAYRGYGAIQGNFALESAMDRLASELKMDPVALRQKNMIAEGETSPVFRIMGEGTEGVEMNIESCKLEECIRRGKALIGWDGKYPRKETAPNLVRGVGMAIAMQGSGIPAIDMGSASLKLNDDGFFNLTVGATDIGTGSDTILAQIAAEALGVQTEEIIVTSSDTDLTPFDTGAYASSTTFVSGNAVKRAAEAMRGMILTEGAKKLRVEEGQAVFDGSDIKRTDGKGSISLKDLATGLYYSSNQKQLSTTGSFVGEKSPPPYMAGFAEVEVDLETGRMELLDYAAVVDCGTPINPNLARIQVEGALVQGIGMAMYEDVGRSPEGRLWTNNLMHYDIPTRKDVPMMKVEFVQSSDPSGPYGAKSVGEIGIDTPPAAIANALYNATGVRITTLPITAEKIWTALKEKGSGGPT